MSGKSPESSLSRRGFIAGTMGLAAGTLFAPAIARAAPPVLRYATASIIGPGEIETVIMSEWFRKNVLKRHGKEYVIEESVARGTPGTATLLAAEQADIATSAFPIFATMIQRQAVEGGVTAIAEIHQDGVEGYASNIYAVLDDSDIRTVADFKGKTIAVNAFGAIVDIILRHAVRQAGMDPKNDIRVVEMPFANIGAALRQGRIDVGTLAMPFQIDEMAKGGIRKVADAVGVLPPYPILFQVARTKYLEENGDAVRAWLADYVEAQEWIYDPANRAKVMEVTADLMKTDPASLDTYFLTEKDFKRQINPCMPSDSVQQGVNAMHELGFISEQVDVRPHIDNSYLPRECKA